MKNQAKSVEQKPKRSYKTELISYGTRSRAKLFDLTYSFQVANVTHNEILDKTFPKSFVRSNLRYLLTIFVDDYDRISDYLTSLKLSAGFRFHYRTENKKTGQVKSTFLEFPSSGNHHSVVVKLNKLLPSGLGRNEELYEIQWSVNFDQDLSAEDYKNFVTFLKSLQGNDQIAKNVRKQRKS